VNKQRGTGLARSAIACAALLVGSEALAQPQFLAVTPASQEPQGRAAQPRSTGENTSDIAASRTTLQAVDPPALRLTIGPEGVANGVARYARRSTRAGQALVVGFSATPVAATGSGGPVPLSLPISAMRLTSGFGPRWHPLRGGYRFHSGVDLAAPTGSPLTATSDGVITSAGRSGGYGLLVAIDHGGGVETRYGHLSALNVAIGEPVRAGQVIGFVGSTGESTGPHVHYEVRVNGRPVDPL
jgi:murein DD-endopeptidase MepM/ murein hydrolase activator NlpD